MTKKFNARSARNPKPEDRRFVVIADAPKHYISGYGLVGPGAVVSLADGVEPGKWLQEIHPKDEAKVQGDPEAQQELAAKAAERKEKAAK